jgi:predicted  nucleic acid-binding Zn-ribbon protein
MAKNLLEKLNVLLQANLHNLSPDLSRLNPRRAGKSLDREIAALRKQLEVSAADETEIEAQITAMTEAILQWDAAADEAIKAGKDAQARYAVQQMETEKRRLVILQTELDEHRQTMAALMRQLNEFESVLKAAQKAQVEVEEETATLSEAIRQARETVQAEAGLGEVPVRVQVDVSDVDNNDDEETISRDLDQRRSRLAKPDA